MVSTEWRVKPAIQPAREGIWVGAGGSSSDGLWLGTLAEAVSGKQPPVWLSTAKEQVISVVGKRGSGKSFTLGVIAEGLSVTNGEALGRHATPRAVLLFDPLDVYWTTKFAVGKSDNREAQRHYELAQRAGLPEVGLDVEAWIPGREAVRSADPEWFKTLTLPVPALGLEEWELLVRVNILTDPMGQALVDALGLVRESGFQANGDETPPKSEFDLAEVVSAVDSDEIAAGFHAESIRGLKQRLKALAGTGLFAAQGTATRDMLAAGRLSVVMLGRLPQSYRTAVVAVLTRRLMEERSEVTFAEKRLALDPDLDSKTRAAMQELAVSGVPRTVVMLDEAQSFLAPGPQSAARQLFVRLVKEGRNMGLSAILATQQPSALDQRVLSQVETFISHQLVTEADIRAVRENLKSQMPDSIQRGNTSLDFGGLLRQFPPGVCLVSAADLNVGTKRSFVASVRPRATVHGGIEL
jgi:uncharacterized protein